MRGRAAARGMLVMTALLTAWHADAADRQIRPFVGTTFGGATTFVDPETAIGKPNRVVGVSAVVLGEVLGAEIEAADAPGFFQYGDKQLVKSSHVTTITGNVIIAAPHRLTEYSLRPYFVGGFGLMHVTTTTTFNVFDVSSTLPAVNVGGGVVAFVTNHVGFSGDIRRFQSVGDHTGNVAGLSFGQEGEEHLSFWRGTAAIVFRY